MATSSQFVALQQAHHSQMLAIRDKSAEVMSILWERFGGFDDQAAERFTTAAAQLSMAAQASTATVARGFMAGNDRLIGQAATSSIPSPIIRNGVDVQDVYQRAIVQARRSLKTTGDPVKALASGGARARATVRTDVILANRETISNGQETRPWVVGYRRVLTGKSCALCASASTQRYKVAKLHPIHPNCDCDVAEIFGTEDPGLVINEGLLENIQAAGKETGTPKYWEGPYMVDEEGVVRYRKNEYLKDPDTGKQLYNEKGNRRRRSVPGDRVVPEVREHGELGEMLTDKRHAFTDAESISDATSPTVLESVPARVVDGAGSTPKRTRRAKFDVSDPEVVEAARKWGVTPDEILVGRERISDVKASMYEAAERVQSRAYARLYDWQAFKIQRPPRVKGGDGSYDWMEQLHPKERRRLSRNWWTDNPGNAPDQIAQQMKDRDVLPGGDVDDLMAEWLTVSREYEAAGAIRRGKNPASNAYSGAIDPSDLVEIEGGYDAGVILGSANDLDIAGHIAEIDRAIMADDAAMYLRDAMAAQHGPAPFRMSFQGWEAEVRTLEYGLKEFPDEMPANSRARLSELVPRDLDEGQDFEDLYAAIVTKAQQADLEVPDYVGIPWQ